MKKYIFFILVVLSALTSSSYAATFYSRASGAWGTATNWSTAGCGGAANTTVAPGALDVVNICSGHTITVSSLVSCTTLNVNAGGTLTFSSDNQVTVSGLTTVDGTITTVNGGGSAATNILQCNGNVTINGTGIITNNGRFNMANSTTFTINNGGLYTHNPENNDAANATMFNRTGATNTFGASSNITMLQWHSAAIPLGQYAPAFGNITFSAGLVWDQDGTFSPDKIKGNVLTTNGQINFDDGTGLTTVLTIGGSVTTSGTANIIFAQGPDRNLTLTMGALTHNGASPALVAGMYQTHGVLVWTVNGTTTLNGDFTAIQAKATPVASSCNFNTTGDLIIGGTSLFDINRGLTGTTSPATVTVGGASTWSTSGWIRFIDGGNGVLTFTTSSLASSGAGKVNLKMAANSTIITGDATINCTNNFAISGGNDFYIYGGNASTYGDGTNDVNLTIGGTFSMNNNAGNIFYCLDLLGSSSAGILTANIGAIDFQGGTLTAHNGNHTLGGLNTINVTNTFNMNFSNGTDQVILINNISAGSPVVYNNVRQNLTIGGNLTMSGNVATATFRGSASTGVQNVNITGNFNMGGGAASRFTSGSLGHALTVNIAGSLNVTAGEFWYSYRPGTVTSSVTGNMAVSGGSLAIKGDLGASTHTVNGNYSQTGGLYSLYHDDAKLIDMTDVIAMTINGTFSQTAGVLNYDNRPLSTATHIITLFGPSFTIGGTSITNRAVSPFTAITNTGAVFGEFYFARTGITTYSNTAAPATTHFFQGIKQFVNSVTTVDASGSAEPFLISSNSVADNIAGINAKWALNVNGILDMGVKTISSFPSITAYFSGIRVNAAARLRTSNAAGFYDGTTSACLQPQVFSGNTTFRMDFNLDATSTVEYYASVNQVVTGKFPNAGVLGDVALATAAQYHYGYLDINNMGTLGTNFAFPALPVAGTGNVFVRTSMLLTRGEFNLAGSGTGQTITMENGDATGITRDGTTTNGYVKSEEANAGNNRAKIMWNMGTNTGAHIYPFAVTTGTDNYVPFTFNKTTAGAADVTISTRATAANDNLPWAAVSSVAAVTSMASAMGGLADASISSVIDRWWDITASAAVTGDLTFKYRGVENTTTLAPTGNFGSQHWNGTGWDAIVGSNVGVTTGIGTVVSLAQSAFSPRVLANLNAVLPIELLSFDAVYNGKYVDLTWATATESNNDYFTIERSPDGINFESIAVVKGAGNSLKKKDYFTQDKKPLTGLSYYRLKQTDFDKTTSYSVIRSISIDEKDQFDFVLYPNPSIINEDIHLLFQGNEDDLINLVITDITGKVLSEKEIKLKSSATDVEIKHDFNTGIYFIKVSNKAGKIINQKFIVQ